MLGRSACVLYVVMRSYKSSLIDRALYSKRFSFFSHTHTHKYNVIIKTILKNRKKNRFLNSVIERGTKTNGF